MRSPAQTGRRAVLVAALVVLAVLVAGLAYRSVRNAGSTAPVALEQVEVSGTATPPRSGSWEITQGVVGYRVFEPLDVTVTGRSTAVTGRFELSTDSGGVELVDAVVDVDLAQLRSDAEGRDRALRTRLLETDRYPRARFTLDAPVTVGELPPGEPVAVTAPGMLTVRERDRPAVAELQVRWDGDALRVVGQIEVSLSGYGVEVPAPGGVPGIEDAAVVELDVTAGP